MADLSRERVLGWGTDRLRQVLGRGFEGSVFLVGGAFKSLLHGRPPRDLDLWAPCQSDRSILVDALVGRGAQLVRDNRPYQAVYHFDGLSIDIGYSTDATTLEERCARADLGLAAVGVARQSGAFRCVVSAQAIASVSSRAVLLQRPVRNWKYALFSLDRMERYASELGYSVPVLEREHLWAIYFRQDAKMRKGMVDRYRRVAKPRPATLARAGAA